MKIPVFVTRGGGSTSPARTCSSTGTGEAMIIFVLCAQLLSYDGTMWQRTTVAIGA